MKEPAKKYLCDIDGLCAVFNKETLNGRGYSEIYRRLLDGQDYRFNEMLKRGGILCELGHPAQESADFERTETDLNKVCAILTDISEGEDSRVYAKGKVLDTPAGRIFMAMKPFYNFGFSSRGSYDAVDDSIAEGPDGWNQDTYIFKGFDIVALPATEESVISATESLDSKKKRKSARESLDINEIASAANVTPEEINRELDKIFTEKGDIEGSELVSMKEYSDMRKDEETQKTEEDPSKDAPTDIQNDQSLNIESPASEIKNDLTTALAEAASLREELDRAKFDSQNMQAELEALRSEKEDLLHRAVEAEKALKDYEEIKSLSQRLVESYKGFQDEFNSENEDLRGQLAEEQKTATKWQKEADSAANEKKLAEESLKESKELISKYKSRLSSISTELKNAKESLVEVYSKNYGIAKESISKCLGANYRVSQIKPAIESIAKDSSRLYASIPVIPKIQKSTPKVQYNDEIEKELFEALSENL